MEKCLPTCADISLHSLRFLRSFASYLVSFDAQFYAADDLLLRFARFRRYGLLGAKIRDISTVPKSVVPHFCEALSSKKDGRFWAPYRNTKPKWGPWGRTHPSTHLHWARVLPPNNNRIPGAIREAKFFCQFLINF